jgi:hypothetical protein
MKNMFNPPKDNKPQDKKKKDDRPPINPAPPLTAEERAYWGKVESDRKKREEIAKIEGYPDIEKAAGNIEIYEKSKKAIGEFLGSIIDDFRKSAKTQYDFSVAIERISMLCNDHKIRREDVDSSWMQEQVNEIVNAVDKFENSKGSKLYNFSRLTDIFETSSGENISEKNSSDLVARALSQKIENSEKLSIPTQRAIENFSKIVTYAGIESKMEFLLSVFYNQSKLLGGTKMEIISNMAIFNPSEEFFRQIENYVAESKDDAYKLMSAIDVLDYCAMISSQGIRHKRIKDITFNITNAITSNKKTNYFVATKAFQLSHKLENPHDPRLKYPADYKTLKAGEDLESDYNIKPLVEAEDQYKLKIIEGHCFYRKASEKYGVIYEPDGKVNSFFVLNPEATQKARAEYKRIEPQRISLDEILNREGFMKQNTEEGEREYRNLTRNYLALLELPLKVTIENYLKVKIDSLSVREQLQFLKLLSTKTPREMIGVGDFLNKSQDDKGKINRMKSFLSLEFNHEEGESVNIMKIDSDPTIKEETKEKLFENYAQLVDESEKTVEEIMKIIGDIFYDKKIDKNQIHSAILRKASELFEKAQVEFLGANITATFERDGWVGNEKLGNNDAERLVNYVMEMKDGILEKLTADIKKERMMLQKELKELETAASIINGLLSNLTRSQFEKEMLATSKKAVSAVPERKQIVDEEIKNAKEMVKYSTPEGFPYLYDDFLEENKKFDSGRIKKMIEHYRSLYSLTDQDIKNLTENDPITSAYFKLLKTQEEKDTFIEEIRKGAEASEDVRPYKEVYKPLVKKMEQVLQYQTNLELQIEKLIYGQEVSELLSTVFSKYNEIISASEKLGMEVKDIFKEDKTVSKEDANEIALNLIKKADEIMKQYTGSISNRKKENLEKTLEELDKYNAENIHFLSVAKAVKGEGTSPEDIKGIEYQEITAENLIKKDESLIKQMCSEFIKEINNNSMAKSDADFQDIFEKITEKFPQENESHSGVKEVWQMVEYYWDNWKKYPLFRNDMVEGFVLSIVNNKEKTKIYRYQSNNDTLVFMRVDDLENGKKYCGSLNTAPTLKGLAAGMELFKKVLNKLNDNTVEATSIPQDSSSSAYVEQFGFIINGLYLNFDNTGVPLLKIERSKGNNNYKYKKSKTEDIINEYENKFSNNKFDSSKPSFILKFKKNSPEFFSALDSLVNDKKYIISRYFFTGENNGDVYCAFEKSKS